MESKKVTFFNNLSFITLLSTLFLCLFFFIPYSPITLEASKGFLLSVGVTLSLFFWLISRLGDGKFVIPKDKLIIFAAIIPLVFLISSFFSSSFYISLFGSGFEVGTFGSMLVLFITFFLSIIHFQTEKHLWQFIWVLFIGAIVLIVFQLFNIVIGVGYILPGSLQGLSSGNLVGSWNNFALVLGIMVLLALFTLELLKTKKSFRIIQYIVLILGILLLIVINSPLVWLLVGTFSVIIFVYIISIQRTSHDNQGEGRKNNFPFASLVIMLVSLMFLVGGNLVANLISQYINLNSSEVRPSLVATTQVFWDSFKHNPVLGTGPNTFVIDWALWQPKDVAQTLFWNSDFTNGFSALTTFAVTSGVLGLLAFLLFLVVYVTRGIQSIRVALQNIYSNYFIMTILMISLYSWITVVLCNPSIVIIMLAFASSGILIGLLVNKQAIAVKEFSFLNDPRHSFFSILGLLVLMVVSISLTYVYVEKFTSLAYFSKSLKGENTIESLYKSEQMLNRAIALDKNDVYYRNLSQLYISHISLLIKDENVSKDTLKSDLQQLVNLAQNSALSAVTQNPNQYLNYMNLGSIYSSLVPLSVENSYENALAAYDKALLLAPNNPSIILSKASLEFLKENNSEARKYIKQALDVKPNYIDAIFLLVQIETNEGNLSEAIKQAEYAGELAPNDATVFFRLGLLRYNNNDYSGAVSAFEKAVILDNTYLNARYFLAQSYKKVGRTDDSMKQFEILNQLVPDNQLVKDAINSAGGSVSTPKDSEKTDLEATKPPLEEKQ